MERLLLPSSCDERSGPLQIPWVNRLDQEAGGWTCHGDPALPQRPALECPAVFQGRGEELSSTLDLGINGGGWGAVVQRIQGDIGNLYFARIR